MASNAEYNPEKRRSTQENVIYHVAWMVGIFALLAVGAEAAQDIFSES